jgi:hypothetical protein
VEGQNISIEFRNADGRILRDGGIVESRPYCLGIDRSQRVRNKCLRAPQWRRIAEATAWVPHVLKLVRRLLHSAQRPAVQADELATPHDVPHNRSPITQVLRLPRG